MDTARTVIRLPRELHTALTQRAAERGNSLNEQMVLMLRYALTAASPKMTETTTTTRRVDI